MQPKVIWNTGLNYDFLLILEHTFAYAGECNHCNIACLAIYDPVCATDSNGKEITYGSQCELDSYNCRYPFSSKWCDTGSADFFYLINEIYPQHTHSNTKVNATTAESRAPDFSPRCVLMIHWDRKDSLSIRVNLKVTIVDTPTIVC